MRRQGVRNIRAREEKRKALRRKMTLAEVLLWRELKGRGLGGWKFRRQQSVGIYIVDSCCPEAGLVVELDGSQHFEEERARRDARRTAYMESQGLRVVRFPNRHVEEHGMGVAADSGLFGGEPEIPSLRKEGWLRGR